MFLNKISLTIISRKFLGYSLIEVMTVIVVLGIVLGLLFAYQDEGWKLFYQSSGRGLSTVKAKLAIKLISNDLREANKTRVGVGNGLSYGVPFPDDVTDNSPYLYFTKPILQEGSGETIGYDYILYYFAKPKVIVNFQEKNKNTENKYLVLKVLKFLNQSKFYTEDLEKTWPFMPPLVEIQKSRLPEDEDFISSLMLQETEVQQEQGEFLDHYARLKKESRNIPVSGNFLAMSLSDPFTKGDVNISFGFDNKNTDIVSIMVLIEESPVWYGLMAARSEFEVNVTPRN